MLTDQAIFDRVWNHFIVNKSPRSFGPDPCASSNRLMCLYRGPNGERCPAGLFIPDEMYDVAIEGKSVDVFTGYMPEVSIDSRDLLDALQSAHDGNGRELEPGQEAIDYWRQRMKRTMEEIASEFNLMIPAFAQK